MKRRGIAIAATAFCLATLLIWLCWPRQHSTQHPTQTVAVSTPDAPPAGLPPTKEEQQQIIQERDNKIRADIEGTNVPINFWGRVVDQDGKPLGGVTVSYHYQTEHVLLPGVAWARGAVHKGQKSADAQGLFSIGGLHGHSLTLEAFSKAGYRMPAQFSPALASYDYYGATASGKFIPDRKRPVEFVMISESAVAPLVLLGGNFGKTVRVATDGTPLRWNVWTGKKDPNGNLQVTFLREPGKLAHGEKPSFWEAKVQVIGGGIVEAAGGEELRQAPEDGYLSAVDYPKAEQQRGNPSRAFYVKTADRKYGRIELELFPNDDGATARCLIKTQMNPEAGSRNLAR